jgi:hypothetical protein
MTTNSDGVRMKDLSVMLLLVLLIGCAVTSPFDGFSKDKDACEQKTQGSSPYSHTTGADANDQFAACMKDHGWQNVQR